MYHYLGRENAVIAKPLCPSRYCQGPWQPLGKNACSMIFIADYQSKSPYNDLCLPLGNGILG